MEMVDWRVALAGIGNNHGRGISVSVFCIVRKSATLYNAILASFIDNRVLV